MVKMDMFAGEKHEGDEDLDTMPPLKVEATEIEILDYMVLVIARFMVCGVAFKGGYLLNKVLGGYSRLTHDIDFSIGKQEDYEGIKEILGMIAERLKKDGYIAEYMIKEQVKERMSGGIDMYAHDGHKILGVDVGWHDIDYGVKDYDLEFASVQGFTVERMLADKLIAITTRKKFRRTKDLYDFYAITSFFDVDMQKLAEYIERREGVQWENIPFNEDVLVQYKRAWDKLDLRSSESGFEIGKPEFNKVLSRYYEIALPLKSGSVKGKYLISYDFAVDKVVVCCSSTALARNGLVMFDVIHLDLQTKEKELDKMSFGCFKMFYNSTIDFKYCLTESPSNKLILLPSKERAIVECIKHLDWIDEGLLIEGIKNYIAYFWNEKLLYETAKHFDVPRETIDYWIEEAKNDYEV